MIHFLTFASSNLAPTLKRIGKEAEESGFFDKIYLYDEHKLDKTFRKAHKKYFRENPRGYGYWIWKPYLILKTLKEKMADRDILVFLDAGCEIHRTGEKRWKEYLKYLEEFDCILSDHENYSVRQMTKMDMLVHFSMERDKQVLNKPQFWAGGIIIKKTEYTLNFFLKWFDYCERHKSTLLNGSPSIHAELQEFIEHRHDQSMLTLLCLQEDPKLKNSNDGDHFKILRQKEVYSRLPDWSDMAGYPFWARRNKEYVPPSLFIRIRRKISGFLK